MHDFLCDEIGKQSTVTTLEVVRSEDDPDSRLCGRWDWNAIHSHGFGSGEIGRRPRLTTLRAMSWNAIWRPRVKRDSGDLLQLTIRPQNP
jgi:hypothetical protein